MPITNLPNGLQAPIYDANGVQVLGDQQAAIASLTDSTTGTANDAVADVGAAFSQATLNNNFADVTAKINAILTALRAAKIIAT